MTSDRVDVDRYLDGLKFGRFHICALIIGVIIMLVDGYEVGVIGLVLPMLADDYGVSRASLTWVLSAQQIGMVLGAYFIAPLADRFGRKPLVVVSLLWVGLASFLTTLTTDVTALALCRLATGIFASTLIANLVAWTSEMAPARHRALMVTIVLIGSLAGALLGSAIQAFVIEPFGWQGAFWAGALLPLALVPATIAFFQESPRFIAARRPDDPRLARFPRLLGDDRTILVAPPAVPGTAGGKGGVRDLFRGGLAAPTLLLWLAFVLDFIFVTAWFWKTTIFHDLLGYSWDEIALLGLLDMVFSMIGMLTIGFAISRFGISRVLPFYFFASGVALVCMGLTAGTWGVYLFLALLAAARNAGHTGLAIVAADLYSTRTRATGVGWAYGAGRIASIFGPPFGAVPLQQGWPILAYLSLLAVPLLLAALAAWFLFATGIGRAGPSPNARTRPNNVA